MCDNIFLFYLLYQKLLAVLGIIQISIIKQNTDAGEKCSSVWSPLISQLAEISGINR